MNERFYIDPENAQCPECDGGKRGTTWSTCRVCSGAKTWAGTMERVKELEDCVKELESDLEDARGEIADLKAEMEA